MTVTDPQGDLKETEKSDRLTIESLSHTSIHKKQHDPNVNEILCNLTCFKEFDYFCVGTSFLHIVYETCQTLN